MKRWKEAVLFLKVLFMRKRRDFTTAEAGGKNFYFKHLYGPVMSLLRVIENGPARQQQVDGVIERCSATYNV